MNTKKLQENLYSILIKNDLHNPYTKYFDVAIVSLICLSIFLLVFETEKSIFSVKPQMFYYLEFLTVLAFTIELFARLWSCTLSDKYSNKITGRIKFFFTPLMLIDFLAILPFYLPLIGHNLLFLRMLRMLRILFRIIKLTRYCPGINMIARVLSRTKRELSILFIILVMIVIIISSITYHTEHAIQPHVFTSIPKTIYWCIITLTTVGYGDMVPLSIFGKVIASMSGIMGIIIFAIPTAIISSTFLDEMQKEKLSISCDNCSNSVTELLKLSEYLKTNNNGQKVHCPHCGHKICIKHIDEKTQIHDI